MSQPGDRRQAALRAALLGFALMLPLAPAGAQSGALEPGTRVRVEAPRCVPYPVEGTIVSRRGDALRIERSRGNAVTVPIATLTRVEVSRGRSRLAGALRGGLWGAAAGLGVGVVSVVASNGCVGDCSDEPSDREYLLATPAAGALLGAGVGALIGRERWERVPLPARATVGPGRARGFSLAVHARF